MGFSSMTGQLEILRGKFFVHAPLNLKVLTFLTITEEK